MNTRIVILGAGESGTGAALLAKAKGFDVFVSDKSQIADKYKQQLIDGAIPYEEGTHTNGLILNAAEIIKSPGIPFTVPLVKEALALGIPVIDELEFAARYTEGKIIAITGTNGKTTTTLLTYHLLKESGLSVGVGGNVGKSMARQLAEQDFDWWVLEVSSFQIDGMLTFKPHVVVLLNITPDHLDRYDGKIQNYIDAKFRLFQNQTAGDYYVVFKDDSIVSKTIAERKLKAQPLTVALSAQVNQQGAFVAGEALFTNIETETEQYALDILPLTGKHNQINTMASILSAKLAGAKTAKIKEGFRNFQNAQHRLELIGNLHGIDFINDSKATNVDAVYYALESFHRPIVWIAGGVDKGNNYEELEPVSSQVKALICLGKDNSKLKEFYDKRISIIEETESMQEAVRIGYQLAKDRDVVLLSPACASFDLFKNYEDRGNQFRMAYRALEREIELKKLSNA